jgi:hypothetical protein
LAVCGLSGKFDATIVGVPAGCGPAAGTPSAAEFFSCDVAIRMTGADAAGHPQSSGTFESTDVIRPQRKTTSSDGRT